MASCIIPTNPTTTTGSFPSQQPPNTFVPPNNIVGPAPTTTNPINTRIQAFPYDLTMDTLAHMNCPGDTNPGDNTFITFKMASYSKGLSLSSKFREQTKTLNTAQKEAALKKSPFYNSAAQLALSQRGNPGQYYSIAGQPAIQSLLPFGHPHISKLLAQHNVIYTLNNRSKMELQVPIPGSSYYHLASSLTDSHILTLTYNNGRSRKPITLGQNLFYGKSYALNFKGGPNNKDYLFHVKEENLVTNKEEGSWTCPSSMRFAIFRHDQQTTEIFRRNITHFQKEEVKPEDVCETDNRVLSRRRKQIFDALFPPQTFSLGRSSATGELCIKPVDSRKNCYAGKNIVRIEFDQDVGCSNYDQFRSCPSYFSVCMRK